MSRESSSPRVIPSDIVDSSTSPGSAPVSSTSSDATSPGASSSSPSPTSSSSAESLLSSSESLPSSQHHVLLYLDGGDRAVTRLVQGVRIKSTLRNTSLDIRRCSKALPKSLMKRISTEIRLPPPKGLSVGFCRPPSDQLSTLIKPPFRKAFPGSSFIEWMKRAGFARDDSHAVMWGDVLLLEGLFRPLVAAHINMHGDGLYRFWRDEKDQNLKKYLSVSQGSLWVDMNPNAMPLDEMIRLSHTTVLGAVKLGSVNKVSPVHKRIMVALDGLKHSHAAFLEAMEHVNVHRDAVFVVLVRALALDSQLQMYSIEAPPRVKYEFRIWLRAREILRPYMSYLEKSGVAYGIISPRRGQPRRALTELVHQLRITSVFIGKHDWKRGPLSPDSETSRSLRPVGFYLEHHTTVPIIECKYVRRQKEAAAPARTQRGPSIQPDHPDRNGDGGGRVAPPPSKGCGTRPFLLQTLSEVVTYYPSTTTQHSHATGPGVATNPAANSVAAQGTKKREHSTPPGSVRATALAVKNMRQQESDARESSTSTEPSTTATPEVTQQSSSE